MRKLRRTIADRATSFMQDWSLPRQLAGQSVKGKAAESAGSRALRPRLEDADTVGSSVCPFCAVGCGLLVYAKNGRPIHIEGDPRSPVNQGTLCPKGSSTLGVLLSPQRVTKVLYRAPKSRDWEEKPLEWAMERIAQKTKRTRDDSFVETLPDGRRVNHTVGLGSLGGATLDNEENYLIKKLLTGGLGVISVENQARI